MYCPNCGAQNKKKQNYCRYCGLHLPDIEKSLLSQLVFGEETRQIKNLRSVKSFFEYVQILLIASVFAGVLLWVFTDFPGGRNLMRISVVAFFVLQAIRAVIEYFWRQSLRENKRRAVSYDAKQNEFETKETGRLIEEKPFSPVPNAAEASTELLFVTEKPNRTE